MINGLPERAARSELATAANYKPIKLKIMKQEELNNILRNLLVAGNIVTVSFEQMREIRKELNRFVKPIQIDVIKSDFETVSFRELR